MNYQIGRLFTAVFLLYMGVNWIVEHSFVKGIICLIFATIIIFLETIFEKKD